MISPTNIILFDNGGHRLIDNGNWLVSWGRGAWDDDPGTGPPPDVSASEVDTEINRELWNMSIKVQASLEPVEPVLAYPITTDQFH